MDLVNPVLEQLLEIGDAYTMRTASGSDYSLRATDLRDGLTYVDIDQLGDSGIRRSVRRGCLVHTGQVPVLRIGAPIEVVGYDDATGDRFVLRTSPVIDFSRVA